MQMMSVLIATKVGPSFTFKIIFAVCFFLFKFFLKFEISDEAKQNKKWKQKNGF